MNSQPNPRRRDWWKACGTDAPKEEIVYCCQLFVTFIVILTGLVNLTFTESDNCLWTGLISGALGYLLPNPSLRRNESVLSDAAIEQLDDVLSREHGGSIYDEAEQRD